MFTQLYLLGGANQDVYTMVHMENGVSLWKINFDKIGGGNSPTNTTNNTNRK